MIIDTTIAYKTLKTLLSLTRFIDSRMFSNKHRSQPSLRFVPKIKTKARNSKKTHVQSYVYKDKSQEMPPMIEKTENLR